MKNHYSDNELTDYLNEPETFAGRRALEAHAGLVPTARRGWRASAPSATPSAI